MFCLPSCSVPSLPEREDQVTSVLSQVQASAERFPEPVPRLCYAQWFSKCTDLEIAAQCQGEKGAGAVDEVMGQEGAPRNEQAADAHQPLQREAHEVEEEEVAVQEAQGCAEEEEAEARGMQRGTVHHHEPHTATASVSSAILAAVFTGEAAVGVKINEDEVMPHICVRRMLLGPLAAIGVLLLPCPRT